MIFLDFFSKVQQSSKKRLTFYTFSRKKFTEFQPYVKSNNVITHKEIWTIWCFNLLCQTRYFEFNYFFDMKSVHWTFFYFVLWSINCLKVLILMAIDWFWLYIARVIQYRSLHFVNIKFNPHHDPLLTLLFLCFAIQYHYLFSNLGLWEI